jgi:hypothetical protein
VDQLVVALDDRGQPVSELSFKITRGQRKMLLANPTKTVEVESPLAIGPSRKPSP